MREDKDIFNNFVFRLGELHIVFAMLKVLGKFIDGSGIDRLFIESDIYGETSLKQLIEEKPMKRAVEAHEARCRAYTSRFQRLFHRGRKEWTIR